MDQNDERVDSVTLQFGRGVIDGIRLVEKLELRHRPGRNNAGRITQYRADDTDRNAAQHHHRIRRQQ